MSTIIAGRFAEMAQAERAVAELAESGIARERIASFFLTPQGQHDAGGQSFGLDDSAGAEDAGTGAAVGAGAGGTVGAVVGLATAPILGPAAPIAGAAVGAYVGSLHGTLNELDPGDQNAPRGDDVAPPVDEPTPRKSGFFVAVAATDDDTRKVVEVLERTGAADLERAEGNIAAGKWDDFDPTSPPQRLVPEPRSGTRFDPQVPRLLSP